MAAVSLLEAVQVGQSGLFAGFLEAGLEEHEAGSCVEEWQGHVSGHVFEIWFCFVPEFQPEDLQLADCHPL